MEEPYKYIICVSRYNELALIERIPFKIYDNLQNAMKRLYGLINDLKGQLVVGTPIIAFNKAHIIKNGYRYQLELYHISKTKTKPKYKIICSEPLTLI